MNVTSKGLAVLAGVCGVASARALATRSRHERLNADLAATLALIRAGQSILCRGQSTKSEVRAIECQHQLLRERTLQLRMSIAAHRDGAACREHGR